MVIAFLDKPHVTYIYLIKGGKNDSLEKLIAGKKY